MFAEHLVLHALGLCVAFLLALPVLWLARKDPVVGHRLLLILLLASLVLPAFTLPLAGKASATGDRVLARFAVEPAVLARDSARGVDDPPIVAAAKSEITARSDASTKRDASPERRVAPATGAATSARRNDPSTSASAGDRSITLSAHAERERTATTTIPRTSVAEPTLRQRTRDVAVGINAALRRSTPYVIVAWVLGVLLVGRRHLQRLVRTARLVRDAVPVDDEVTLSRWRIAAADHPLAKHIELRRSDAVEAPACWGIAKPVILLPAVDAATPDATVFALRHELVHLERRDPLAALAQAALKTVYWFHPVAWWLSAQIDRTRELACDQLVAANSSQRKRYALALIDHARAALPASAAAPSIPRSPTLLHWAPTLPQLRRRIEMLLNKNTPLTLRRRLLVLGGAATAVVLLLAAQGTVAATMLSDAPLSERLVAFCPPKPNSTTVAPLAPVAPIPPVAPTPPRRPARAMKPKAPQKPHSSSVSQGTTPSPDSFAQFDAADFSFVLPTSSDPFAAAVNPGDDNPLRDALIEVLTETSDQDARVTAAKALGTQLHDAAVRRAFARVLRDEWEGSEVRETVGDALLRSPQFSPEAHEIIAALLKRENGEFADDVAPAELADFGDSADATDLDDEELAALRAQLAADLEQLEISVDSLDLDTLEDLSELKAEFGDFDELAIDVTDAIDSLESDEACEDTCVDTCEESCEDDCDDECDDEAEEAEESAEDRRDAIVELLRGVHDQNSADAKQHLLQALLAKRDAGSTQVRVSDLLRAMTAPRPAPSTIATPTMDRALGTEDT